MIDTVNLVNDGKVLDAMSQINRLIEQLTLNEHEKIVVFQTLAAYEQSVLERKNLACLMFSSLNKR
jgi:hypothetical protein